jgi:hypothetical protein
MGFVLGAMVVFRDHELFFERAECLPNALAVFWAHWLFSEAWALFREQWFFLGTLVVLWVHGFVFRGHGLFSGNMGCFVGALVVFRDHELLSWLWAVFRTRENSVASAQ